MYSESHDNLLKLESELLKLEVRIKKELDDNINFVSNFVSYRNIMISYDKVVQMMSQLRSSLIAEEFDV